MGISARSHSPAEFFLRRNCKMSSWNDISRLGIFLRPLRMSGRSIRNKGEERKSSRLSQRDANWFWGKTLIRDRRSVPRRLLVHGQIGKLFRLRLLFVELFRIFQRRNEHIGLGCEKSSNTVHCPAQKIKKATTWSPLLLAFENQSMRRSTRTTKWTWGTSRTGMPRWFWSYIAHWVPARGPSHRLQGHTSSRIHKGYRIQKAKHRSHPLSSFPTPQIANNWA